TEPQPRPEPDGEHRARRHDAVVELALHHLEALDARRVARHRVVDEQARQVEQAGEPGHHEDDVEGFDPEHFAWPAGSAVPILDACIAAVPPARSYVSFRIARQFDPDAMLPFENGAGDE